MSLYTFLVVGENQLENCAHWHKFQVVLKQVEEKPPQKPDGCPASAGGKEVIDWNIKSRIRPFGLIRTLWCIGGMSMK